MQNLFKKNHNKVGILGGTFDHPHIGHVKISKIALKKFNLNKLIWIVTKKNPLKIKPYFSRKMRIKLCKDLIKNYKKISVKYFDDIVKSKNTYDVLKYLKNKNKGIELYFIIGADNFIKFHKWNNWRNIPKIAKLVVFGRANYSVKALKSVAAKKLKKDEWIYINSKKINISSSLIRKF